MSRPTPPPGKTGRNVSLGLVAATIVEYIVAVSQVRGALLLIAAIALVKATLIVVYFMHIGRLRVRSA